MRVDNWPDSRPDNSNYYIFDPVKYIKERVHYFRSHITPERNSRELPCYHMDNPIGLTWLDWSLVGDKCHVFLYLRINIWFLCFFNCFFFIMSTLHLFYYVDHFYFNIVILPSNLLFISWHRLKKDNHVFITCQ
jgi:hypothetical protein